MMHRKLRVGLWLDAMTVPAWAHAMLERLHHSSYAEIHLIICPVQAVSTRLPWGWRTGVYDLFHALDQRLWRVQPDSLAPQHIHPLLKEVPRLEMLAADQEAMRAYDLDMWIDLGAGERRDATWAADVARYGVWGYGHGAEAGVVGFWEVMRQYPVTHTHVYLRQNAGMPEQVVFRSSSTTDPWSPARHRHDLFWKSVPFLPRQLEALHRLGPEAYFARLGETPQNVAFDDQCDVGTPSNRLALMWIARYLSRLLGRWMQKLWSVEQWFLLYNFQDNISLTLSRYKTLRPPKDRLWADPHVVVKHGRHYLFFEELIHRKGRGHIAVLEMDQDGGPCGEVKVVLEQGYHLSYPYLFHYQDVLYMIPETKANKTIELYECVAFPDTWRHRINLMEDIRAVDTTLLFHHDKWWLLTSLADHEAASVGDELFLFYADNPLTTQWHPHPLNPIISDARKARMAGRLLQLNGKIYRPSQNGAKRYGYGWNLHEIVELTETSYVEKTVSRVQPDWDRRLIGTHSLAYAEGLTVIDGLKQRRRFL